LLGGDCGDRRVAGIAGQSDCGSDGLGQVLSALLLAATTSLLEAVIAGSYPTQRCRSGGLKLVWLKYLQPGNHGVYDLVYQGDLWSNLSQVHIFTAVAMVMTSVAIVR